MDGVRWRWSRVDSWLGRRVLVLMLRARALVLSSGCSGGARSLRAWAGVLPGYVRQPLRKAREGALPRGRLLERAREVEEGAVHAGCVCFCRDSDLESERSACLQPARRYKTRG